MRPISLRRLSLSLLAGASLLVAGAVAAGTASAGPAAVVPPVPTAATPPLPPPPSVTTPTLPPAPAPAPRPLIPPVTTAVPLPLPPTPSPAAGSGPRPASKPAAGTGESTAGSGEPAAGPRHPARAGAASGVPARPAVARPDSGHFLDVQHVVGSVAPSCTQRARHAVGVDRARRCGGDRVAGIRRAPPVRVVTSPRCEQRQASGARTVACADRQPGQEADHDGDLVRSHAVRQGRLRRVRTRSGLRARRQGAARRQERAEPFSLRRHRAEGRPRDLRGRHARERAGRPPRARHVQARTELTGWQAAAGPDTRDDRRPVVASEGVREPGLFGRLGGAQHVRRSRRRPDGGSEPSSSPDEPLRVCSARWEHRQHGGERLGSPGGRGQPAGPRGSDRTRRSGDESPTLLEVLLLSLVLGLVVALLVAAYGSLRRRRPLT